MQTMGTSHLRQQHVPLFLKGAVVTGTSEVRARSLMRARTAACDVRKGQSSWETTSLLVD